MKPDQQNFTRDLEPQNVQVLPGPKPRILFNYRQQQLSCHIHITILGLIHCVKLKATNIFQRKSQVGQSPVCKLLTLTVATPKVIFHNMTFLYKNIKTFCTTLSLSLLFFTINFLTIFFISRNKQNYTTPATASKNTLKINAMFH